MNETTVNQKPQFEIIQGSTPTITCSIPDSIDMDLIVNIWLFVSQTDGYKNDKLIVDRKADTITKDLENKTIQTKLTQEETLALDPNKSAVIQIQFLMEDETSVPSDPVWFKVGKNYKGKVMEDAN